MRRSERKKRPGTGVVSGPAGSLLTLTLLLSVLAMLLRSDTVGEPLLRYLLPLCCLLSGTVGALLTPGSRGRRALSLLLSGLLPSGLLLCLAAALSGFGEADRLLLWNSGALLLPPLLALLPAARKRHRGKR